MWTILTVLCLATGALARKQFIVGGAAVNITDFPWQGSYRTSNGTHTCGCVFVGGDWVLTAGHCGGSGAYSMEFGGTDRGSGTVFGVLSVTRHPDYVQSPGIALNDIAVVQATLPISGNDISPATIAPNDNNPLGNGWITGWGKTYGGGDLEITLQGVEIPIISDDECKDIYGIYFWRSSMICVFGGMGGGIGACNGDSGGPLTQGSTLYGLASWAIIGCVTNTPSVYNRVGAFHGWICSETGGGASGC